MSPTGVPGRCSPAGAWRWARAGARWPSAPDTPSWSSRSSLFAQGALSFGVGSTLIARALYAAQDAPTLAGSFATAAFNVGAAVGPWAGGTVIGAGFGYRAPVWVSAGLVALAFAVAGLAARLGQRAVGQGTPRA
ncbi:hypothetical protein ACPCBX_28255 [Streptomyces tuirus]